MSPPDDILRQLGTLADMAPTILWIADPDGAFIFVSRRWQEDTGEPPPVALDSGWAEVVHPDEAPHVQAVLKEAMSFLRRTAQPPARLVTTESRPAHREETPTGASSGESDRK